MRISPRAVRPSAAKGVEGAVCVCPLCRDGCEVLVRGPIPESDGRDLIVGVQLEASGRVGQRSPIGAHSHSRVDVVRSSGS